MPRYAKNKEFPTIIFGILGILILGGVFAYFVTAEDPPVTDRVTFCPVDKHLIPMHTVVILDRTEELNSVQREAIRVEMRKRLEVAEPYEKISFYEIVGRNSVKAEPLLVLCNPTRPAPDSKVLRKLESDELLAAKQFQSRFLDKLLAKLDVGLTVEKQQDSPIMEVLQAVVVHDLKAVTGAGRKRILLFSDMMQHSPEYSHYKESPTAGFFKSSFFKKVGIDLTGTEIYVFYINRAGSASQQPASHHEFWNMYFSRMGASSVAFTPIEGAGWVNDVKKK